MALHSVPWDRLTDGYREFHGPRALIKALQSRRNLLATWDTIWDRMHHQGNVGTASYVLVPALVEACQSRKRSWATYGYAALMEDCREDRRNPEVPDWLQDEYDHAMTRLREMAFEDIRSKPATGTLAQIFSFIAAHAGRLGLSTAVGNLEMNEWAMTALDRYGETLDDA